MDWRAGISVWAPSALCGCALALAACQPAAEQRAATVIAFGAANNQANAQPLWPLVSQLRPAAWIWAGDAVKPRAPTPDALRVAFDTQRANREYAALARRSRMLGVWNTEDSAFFGDESARAAARELFLDFLSEPALSPRRRRPGLFGHHDIGSPPRGVRILLLDCRYLGVKPGDDADLLGAAQWQWLESALAESRAAFNFLVSPIPVIPAEIEGEKWADYPKSRARLLRLIAASGASGVVVLSGGRLVGELSRLQDKLLPYPLFELTSGGMSHADFRYAHDPNRFRVGEVHVGLNFGVAEIVWEADPRLELRLVNIRGEKALGTVIRASACRDPGYRKWLRGDPPAGFD